MKKLITVLFCLLVAASSALADCRNQVPAFDSSPDQATTQLTQWFGPPDKITKDLIRWPIPGIERSKFTAFFTDKKLSGTLIFTAAKRSAEAAETFLKLMEDWTTSIEKEGFMFVKTGKDDSHGLKSVYKEYACNTDRRIKVRLSLSKDTTSEIISAELFTYKEK
jgi:hypothetical protein